MGIESIFDVGMLLVTIAMAFLILWQLFMLWHMKKDHAIVAKRKERWMLVCAAIYLFIGISDIVLQKAIWFALAFLLLGIAHVLPLGGISRTMLYVGGRRIHLDDSAHLTLSQDKNLLALTYENHHHYGCLYFSLQDQERIQTILKGL